MLKCLLDWPHVPIRASVNKRRLFETQLRDFLLIKRSTLSAFSSSPEQHLREQAAKEVLGEEAGHRFVQHRAVASPEAESR